jgi:ankyrin repeat protein
VFAHHATLVHYVAANGVEFSRQWRTPANAVAILRLLVDRGADPDAVCDAYGGGPAQTPLCLLVSSAPPATAGVEPGLVDELCRAGADPNGLADDGLPLWTALTRGHAAAVEALVRGGARVDNLVFAAAAGDLAGVVGYLEAGTDPAPSAGRIGAGGPALDPAMQLEYALIYAAATGRRDVVELLLGRAPDLGATEPLFGATAAGVARYHGHAELADLLVSRSRGGHTA